MAADTFKVWVNTRALQTKSILSDFVEQKIRGCYESSMQSG